MDLLNVLDHKRGTRVAVNGKVYEIGADGVARDVEQEHADKLLQNAKVWKVHDPKRASAVRAQAIKELRGSMRLLDKNGNPVTPPPDTPGPPVDPMMEAYQRPAVDGPPPVPQEEVEAEAEAPEVPESDQAPPESDQAPAADQAVEASDQATEDEWPDPDMSMDIAYLREMAGAYEVKFNARTPKHTLVQRISEAMYE